MGWRMGECIGRRAAGKRKTAARQRLSRNVAPEKGANAATRTTGGNAVMFDRGDGR
jgi:hypothetical protein